MSRRLSPLAVVFLTVFIDLVGFGIVIPLVPLYAEAFHVAAPEFPIGRDIWQRQPGVFIRQGPVQAVTAPEVSPQAGQLEPPIRAIPTRELVAGQFGSTSIIATLAIHIFFWKKMELGQS